MPKDLQCSIIDELNTQQTLTHTLSVIVTVLGCLLSTGGSAETTIQDYIQETLQMKEKFSLKVAGYQYTILTFTEIIMICTYFR